MNYFRLSAFSQKVLGRCQSAWLSQITVDSFEFHTWSPCPPFFFESLQKAPRSWPEHFITPISLETISDFSWQPYFILSGSMSPTELSSAKPPKEIWPTCCVRSFGNRYDWLGVTLCGAIKLLSLLLSGLGQSPNWGKRFPRNTEQRAIVSGGDSVSGPLASESLLTFHWQQVCIDYLLSQTK